LLFVGLDGERGLKTKVYAGDKLLGRILDDGACIKKRKEQTRRKRKLGRKLNWG